MAILAGIDEAGYGPILGPLVVTGVAFRVPDDQIDACLWETLRESCTRKPRPKDSRLAVTDSKELHNSARYDDSLAGLERTVLVMLSAAQSVPSSIADLLARIAPGKAESFGELPWYGSLDCSLPAADSGDIATRTNALRRDFREHGVEFLGAFSEPIPEREYNHLVGETGNKSHVVARLNLQVIRRLAATARPGESVRIFADRLGGRTHYADMLSSVCTDGKVVACQESAERSVYELSGPAGSDSSDPLRGPDLRITYAVAADQQHFPTALASIYSKYLRELFMRQFNAYWSQFAELKPTAGYYTDGHRWLTDAAAVLAAQNVNRDHLVRTR